jgi:hypothetical protein
VNPIHRRRRSVGNTSIPGVGNTYIRAMSPGSRANTMTVKDQPKPVQPFSREVADDER